MNNNVILVPVAARPRTGVSAASLGAGLLSGVVLAQPAADNRAMAPSCAAHGVQLPPQWRLQADFPAMPGLGQQGTAAKTYTHAIGAAAKRGSQTGSLPAWDPV